MTFGVPLLLSGNMNGVLLPRVAMQNDSAQIYQECALQEVIDRWPSILPITDFYPNVEGICSLGREIKEHRGGSFLIRLARCVFPIDGHLTLNFRR